ncbi:unnamed protein product [Lepeophtheirus salmonis]|uniref:(salmon louse) hypothetical protein n=1 Tax=Lepeophtheirus salmonis TaxID=72036 RepID=A0A7R8D864_LEPSM|nr:unnamed protein product [Lepeophtheirus salmonis]CAF3005982.1 unnamed protein product [Lepeophtheirus salmonis]
MEIGNGEKESGSNTGLGGVDNPGFLSVDNADFNSHTYVYDTRRSLSGMTVDALPKESFYQDIKNLHDPANRPTMEELKMGQLAGLDRTPAVYFWKTNLVVVKLQIRCVIITVNFPNFFSQSEKDPGSDYSCTR